ncbi:hypothetical protein diail_4991 [Diaporthe ilicicola]|nr:hypothetical protein diail_4991 [Diaporthe ilicicola]
MVPMILSHNNTLPLTSPNGTIILIQSADNPWAMDLNTMITIVFGVIGIAFQAGHVYHRRARRLRVVKAPEEDVEDGRKEHSSYRQGTNSGPWHPSYPWHEHQEFESARPGLGLPASATPLRGVALGKAGYPDHDVQLGTRSPPEGHAYRRNPWRSNEWATGTNPWPGPTGSALQRPYNQRLQPEFA